MIRLHPTPSSAELADYTAHLHAYMTAHCPDLLEAIFGGTS